MGSLTTIQGAHCIRRPCISAIQVFDPSELSRSLGCPLVRDAGLVEGMIFIEPFLEGQSRLIQGHLCDQWVRFAGEALDLRLKRQEIKVGPRDESIATRLHQAASNLRMDVKFRYPSWRMMPDLAVQLLCKIALVSAACRNLAAPALSEEDLARAEAITAEVFSPSGKMASLEIDRGRGVTPRGEDLRRPPEVLALVGKMRPGVEVSLRTIARTCDDQRYAVVTALLQQAEELGLVSRDGKHYVRNPELAVG